MAKTIIKMNKSRETKGTFFYEEEPIAGSKVMRSCYIEKWAVKQFFGVKAPETLTITIEDK